MKAAITTAAGFVALLVGLYLGFGLPAVLVVGGGAAVIFGLVWESE